MAQRDDFEDFYQATYGRTVALIAAVSGDRVQAEDIAQEAFARALARWPRLRRYDLPEAWVRRVAMRIAIDSGRGRGRAARLSARLRSLGTGHSYEPAPGVPMALTPAGRALLNLPLREREVLVLHYLADLPTRQIAAHLAVPEGTVKARLVAGRRRMESELADHPEGALDA